jgi:hypothetical protein
MAECAEPKKNLALSKCNKLPGMLKGQIETPLDAKIEPAEFATAAALKTFLQAKLVAPLAERWYLWPFFNTFENISEATVYEDTPLTYSPVRDGQYRFRFGIIQNICLHKAMFSHRSNSGRMIFIDDKNQWIVTKDTDGNLMGLTYSMLNTEKFILNDGSVATKSPVVIALLDNTELDKDGEMLSGDIGKIVNQVIRLTDVVVTVVTITDAGDIDVSVVAECDGTPISGLATADFTYLNAAGVAVVITAATESSTIPGQYKLTQAGDLFVDGTINLKIPSVLSIKAYESTGAAAVNIP